MANEEHLHILNEGAEAWNRWRDGNPAIRPDLSGAIFGRPFAIGFPFSRLNLRGANLRKADLSRTELFEADLNRAVLIEANLSRAIFGQGVFFTDLMRADLSRAILSGADLNGAKLIQAVLKGADFTRAILNGADLSGADLTDSKVCFTILGDTDLSHVKGLETVQHQGPSFIGINSIFRSEGKIPEIFLRGTGVPEVFINNMRSLVAAMSPIDFYSCFISYSSNDQEFADRLYADLQAKGVRCWFAPEDLKIGDKFRQRIDDAIRVHDKLLVVLSETSVASSWVESEVESAFEKERAAEDKTVLFPIRLDEAVMKTSKAWAADIRRTRHICDFRHWQDHNSYEKAFQRLLRDLQGEKSESVVSP